MTHVGVQLGVTFGVHEPDILRRIEALEAWVEDQRREKNKEPTVSKQGRPRSSA